MRRLLLLVLMLTATAAAALSPMPKLRVATFNGSLNDDRDGGLIARLEAGDPGARKIAAVIQHVRPDLLLLNEFDYDAEGRAADLFQQRYLAASQFGQPPIEYRYRYFAAVNTGVPSGLDLSGSGRSDGPDNAWGYGKHPGQYGMLVLSTMPLDAAAVRTFRLLRWSALPDAARPLREDGAPFHSDDVWAQARLSSKSHWDVPVATRFGTLHFLVSHPTPPVFDGPEDRNGRRNYDEIRLWAEYLSGSPQWLVDDAGNTGGLPADAPFVLAGDQNADPIDGASYNRAIHQLLDHPRVLQYPAPRSRGGAHASATQGGVNADHKGDPAEDTGNFGPRAGNMRIDYVLPSKQFRVVDSGVFWPLPDETGGDWLDATDHRMVWIDIAPAQ